MAGEVVFSRERDMRAPVTTWLASMGFRSAVEFCLHGAGITDIVAGRYAARIGRAVPQLFEVVAVELKLEDVAGVIRQAKNNRHHCDWSYAAMPAERIDRMQERTIQAFRAAGVGLLLVGAEVVKVVPPVLGAGMRLDRRVKQLWRRVAKAGSCLDVVKDSEG